MKGRRRFEDAPRVPIKKPRWRDQTPTKCKGSAQPAYVAEKLTVRPLVASGLAVNEVHRGVRRDGGHGDCAGSLVSSARSCFCSSGSFSQVQEPLREKRVAVRSVEGGQPAKGHTSGRCVVESVRFGDGSEDQFGLCLEKGKAYGASFVHARDQHYYPIVWDGGILEGYGDGEFHIPVYPFDGTSADEGRRRHILCRVPVTPRNLRKDKMGRQILVAEETKIDAPQFWLRNLAYSDIFLAFFAQCQIQIAPLSIIGIVMKKSHLGE
eukprot:IDg7101t1